MFVNHVDPTQEVIEEDDLWKAQILEVRALDGNHVYARIAWLEIPRELPNGAEKYHAPNELVASNEMSIVSANTVSGGFDISYWNDADDDAPLPHPDAYFWRQYYDKKSGQLSELRKICTCQEPHSPQEIIIRCTNENCKIWLHGRCIIDQARTDAAAKKEKKGRPSIASKNGVHGVRDKRMSIHVPEEGAAPKLLIKDLATEEDEHEEEIRCLQCQEIIE